MHKLAIVTVVVALGFVAPRDAHPAGPMHRLKEERVFIEFTPEKNEAVVILEAESEVGLQRIEVLGPLGISSLSMRAADLGGQAISGFVIETAETPLPQLLATYGEGRYEMLARTEHGQGAAGSAFLLHDLLAEPVINYPFEGAVNVPTSGLTVSWTADAEANGYTVILEQDDSDGLVIQLPPGSNSLSIPNGFLRSQTETQLEIGVLGPNGNRTVKEVIFTTL